MARKRRFRFGLPIVFAGRPSVGGVGLGCQPIRFAPAAYGLTAYCPIQKARGGFFRRGLNSCDDEDMPVICPTCQNVFRGRSKVRTMLLCMGSFSIFSLRARRAQASSVWRRCAKMGG
jgi:hypothetical protein